MFTVLNYFIFTYNITITYGHNSTYVTRWRYFCRPTVFVHHHPSSEITTAARYNAAAKIKYPTSSFVSRTARKSRCHDRREYYHHFRRMPWFLTLQLIGGLCTKSAGSPSNGDIEFKVLGIRLRPVYLFPDKIFIWIFGTSQTFLIFTEFWSYMDREA